MIGVIEIEVRNRRLKYINCVLWQIYFRSFFFYVVHFECKANWFFFESIYSACCMYAISYSFITTELAV